VGGLLSHVEAFESMLKISTSLIVSATVLFSTVGCKYDRSFLQMDSNSGAPFLGLQWAVDSGSRPDRSPDASHLRKTDVSQRLNVNADGLTMRPAE